MVKNTKDLNNPALNGSLYIHVGISKTMATTIKIGLPLSLTDFAMEEERERLTRRGKKRRLSSETIWTDGISIKAKLNLSFHNEVLRVLLLSGSCSMCSVSLLYY